VMQGQVARATLQDQVRAMKMFMNHIGDGSGSATYALGTRSFVASRLRAGTKIATVNKDIRTLKRVFALAIDPRGYFFPGRIHSPRSSNANRAPSPFGM